MSKPVLGVPNNSEIPPPSGEKRDGEPFYELYFVGRLLEELALAEECRSQSERAIHLRACRYYRALLTSPEGG